MWQAFNIPFMQGLEAFLVVAVALAWLRRTGRLALITAVRAGIAVSILAIPAAAQLFSETDRQALWQGALGVAAAVGVALLIVCVARHSRRRNEYFPERADEGAVAAGGPASIVGIFLFVLLVMTRQGMEIALLLSTLLFQMYSDAAVIGSAAGGVALSAAVAWLWVRFSPRVDRTRFLLATLAFLAILLIQLSISGIYRLTEASVLPYSELVNWATEPFGPEGTYGPTLTYALIVVLGGCLLLRRRTPG